jgi:adenylate cyclase
MAKEIERKFLVSGDGWKADARKDAQIEQAYVMAMKARNMRVRIRDGRRATLTIKSGDHGISRDEFEFDVPVSEARPLFALKIGNKVEKTRYKVLYKGFTWEIDVYKGDLAGLVVAEVEMKSEKETPAIPNWVGEELTGNAAYSNQSLALSGLPESVTHVDA